MITDPKIAEEVKDLDYVQVGQLVRLLAFTASKEQQGKIARELFMCKEDERLLALARFLSMYEKTENDVGQALDVIFERVKKPIKPDEDPPVPYPINYKHEVNGTVNLVLSEEGRAVLGATPTGQAADVNPEEIPVLGRFILEVKKAGDDDVAPDP